MYCKKVEGMHGMLDKSFKVSAGYQRKAEEGDKKVMSECMHCEACPPGEASLAVDYSPLIGKE